MSRPIVSSYLRGFLVGGDIDATCAVRFKPLGRPEMIVSETTDSFDRPRASHVEGAPKGPPARFVLDGVCSTKNDPLFAGWSFLLVACRRKNDNLKLVCAEDEKMFLSFQTRSFL